MGRAQKVRQGSAEERPPWDDPTYWEGHTHRWPPVEQRTEEVTHCLVCGHPWPTSELEEAQKA